MSGDGSTALVSRINSFPVISAINTRLRSYEPATVVGGTLFAVYVIHKLSEYLRTRHLRPMQAIPPVTAPVTVAPATTAVTAPVAVAPARLLQMLQQFPANQRPTGLLGWGWTYRGWGL